LVNWLTDCQCEEQNTIDIGELEIPLPLPQAGCDPDPGDPGWTKTCDCIDSSPSFGTVCVTLTQPPPGAVTSDSEVSCFTLYYTFVCNYVCILVECRFCVCN